MKYNTKTIRVLIIEAFDDQELTTFCHDNFPEVSSQFGAGMGMDQKAFRLITWCERRERTASLLDCIKRERPEKFGKYEEQLTGGDKRERTFVDEVESKTDELETVFESARPPTEGRSRKTTPGLEPSEDTHPLTGTAADVKRWFLDELTETEQVFVITAALFHGLERRELLEVFEVVKGILQPAERQSTATSGPTAGHPQDSVAQVDVSREAERTIRVTIAMDQPSTSTASPTSPPAPPPLPLFRDEASLFEVANLIAVDGERYTEHGRTPVRVLEFRSEDQRRKIIAMVAASFQGILQCLDPLLLTMGADSRAVIRNRAAETVGELMAEVDFIRYKQDILLPWAADAYIPLNLTAGLALATVVESGQHVEDVKLLLRHWTTGPNSDLNWTALAAYAQLASSVGLPAGWPPEILNMLETSLRRERIDLLSLAILVARELCRAGHTAAVLGRLSEWIPDDHEAISLRSGAALMFLQEIELSQLAENRNLVDRAVDVFQVGLSDRKLTDSGAVREAMLAKLREWSEESFDKPSLREAMNTVYKRLYARGTDRDKERILFHLQRWCRRDQRFSGFLDNLPKSS